VKDGKRKSKGYQTSLVVCIVIIVALGLALVSTYQISLAHISSLNADKKNLQDQINTYLAWLDGNKTNYEAQINQLISQINELKAKLEELEVVAKFEVSNLTVSPSVVAPGEPVIVTVDVRNIGYLEGTYKMELRVNGEVEEIKNITLNPKEKVTIMFTLQKEMKKSYFVEVEDLNQTFDVVEPILTYKDLRDVLGFQEWRPAEKSALWEVLSTYKSLREKEPTKEQINKLYEMLYEFDPMENYGGHEEKELEFAELLQQLNPYIKNEEKFAEIFNSYGIDPQMRTLIQHLAHIIWLEEYGNLPWSINRYNKECLKRLLNLDPSCGLREGWIDGYYPAMILINGSKSKLEAIKKIVDWARWHMSHIAGSNFEGVYGRLCPENPYTPSLMAVLIKKQGGCHQSTGLIVGLLRSVNIPGEEIHTEDLGIEIEEAKAWWGVAGHGLVYLPSENLYIHGDEIYGSEARHKKYSVEELLWTEREIKGFLRGATAAFIYTKNRMMEEGIDAEIGYADAIKLENGWRHIMYWEEDRGRHLVIVDETIDGYITHVEEKYE
jgi:hypothetical protein